MPRLLGERVMLREYKADDIGEIRKWVNDAQTTRYLSHALLASADHGGQRGVSLPYAAKQPQCL